MKKGKNFKTVQSVEENNQGFFSKFKSRFKIKKIKDTPKITYTQTKPKKTKKITKTKNGNTRKDTAFTSENQIKKIFRLRRNNPKLSTCDIARATGMSDELVKYYFKKGIEKALEDFRKKTDRKGNFDARKASRTYENSELGKATRLEYQARIKLERLQEKKKELQITEKRGRGRPRKPFSEKYPTKQTEAQAGENLDNLFKTEKYPVEHQSDPRYFAGANPPQSVANEEAFIDQKRRNNINRVNTAKMLNEPPRRQTPKQIEQQTSRHIRIAKSHEKQKPKIHLDTSCSYCNEKSNLMDKDYDHLVRQESWRRHEYAEKQKKLTEKEKQLDEKIHKEELTVADQAQKGTELCRKCDQRIPYSQATRSFSIYNEYYCSDHEPNVIDKK